MSIPIWQVDAFSDRPFSGNSAAIVLLDSYPDDQWLQDFAMEMNLSETSFLVTQDDRNSFQLRWFTPTVEVDLCGHATLAAAHTLFEKHLADASRPIVFQTHSGKLTCSKGAQGITLDFPSSPLVEEVQGELASRVCDSLGINRGTKVVRSIFDLIAVVDDAEIVTSAEPDFRKMAEIDTRGVVLTSLSEVEDYDFISRFFAPQSGINEDPVTGSAHCFLAPYWGMQLNRSRLVGYQASSRGGVVHCETIGERVHLTGQAVTVFEGRLIASA
ncbi:MAG: PhzF family phenazine biosynthesis protein [Planctomycetota bacterium]